MSEFSELIKNFDKVRYYMKDFYIYGFKTRSDFKYKSLRTYDNEKRRIESWLNEVITFDNSKNGKQVLISLDSSRLSENPFYKAYRSKSFTDNDICLHFFILDALYKSQPLSVEQLTDKINDKYMRYFEPQTIRLKLNEYTEEGIIIRSKQGKTFFYNVSNEYAENLCDNQKIFIDAISFFSEILPFGVIGNYIMKCMGAINDKFFIKHNFIVHTLEDNILFSIISAIKQKRTIKIINFGKQQRETEIYGVPLKIYVSTQTGRRYLIMYLPLYKRFNSYRLDYIKSVKILDYYSEFDFYAEKLKLNTNECWGISFGCSNRKVNSESLKFNITINPDKEQYIIERLYKEGRNGSIKKVSDSVYEYRVDIFDTNEMMNWVKSFIGRIISIEGNNSAVISKFTHDIIRMKKMYDDD